MVESTRSPTNSRRRVHIFVSGHVQGVFFRATTRAVAQRLGLTGWVRNLPDGRVEIVAEGDASAIERLLRWVPSGPEGAIVTSVETHDEPYRGEFSTFRIRG